MIVICKCYYMIFASKMLRKHSLSHSSTHPLLLTGFHVRPTKTQGPLNNRGYVKKSVMKIVILALHYSGTDPEILVSMGKKII